MKRAGLALSGAKLTRTLRTFERDGMVARTVHHTVPPSVEYALTELGRSLAVPVMALADWTFGHLPQIHANRAAYDGAVREAA